MKLQAHQLDALLTAITYRCSTFPRAELRHKLEAADRAYHLDKAKNTTQNSGAGKANDGTDNRDRNTDQDYSRFGELQNGLVREIAETYITNYVSAFLSKSQVFSMTSSSENQDQAQVFNTILQDQARRTKWHKNLIKVLTDVAKYNICAVDTFWGGQHSYELSRSSTGAGEKLERKRQVWSGNHIQHCDMYNTLFDISVSPEDLAEQGEWSAVVDLYTQVELRRLMDQLKFDPTAELYDYNYKNPSDTEFNIYKVAPSTNTSISGSNTNAANLDYYMPEIVTYESGAEAINSRGRMDWLQHLGMRKATGNAGIKNDASETTQRYYSVTKCYLRLIPSAYGMQTSENSDDDIEIWEIYILEGNHILGTKLLDNAHGLLGLDLAATDSDSTHFNASGPTQISIPYAITAKQLIDRVLAGADRAIGDRAIVDETMLAREDVTSKVPDAKIFTKKGLPANKSLSDYYQSIPYDNSATRNLNADKESVENAGRRAAGHNLAQQGQFIPGNKTLFEYQDIMSNAGSKEFLRELFIEHTLFANIKRKIKINIIQYQESATLTDADTLDRVEIDPTMLYSSSVEFQLIDALMPNDKVMSPNVQQTLFALFAQVPDAFAGYDVAGMVSHILSQSHGLDMEQYKLADNSGAGGSGGTG